MGKKSKMSKEAKERLSKRTQAKPTPYFNHKDVEPSDDETTHTDTKEVDITDSRSKLESEDISECGTSDEYDSASDIIVMRVMTRMKTGG